MFAKILSEAANPTNVKCGGCGRRISAWTSICPGCHATLQDDSTAHFFSVLTICMVLYPLLNLPAFIPGAILTCLSMNIWSLLLDNPLVVIPIMFTEFVVFTILFWKVLQVAHAGLHTLEGTAYKVAKGLFYAYITGCYAIPGIALVYTDEPDANIGLRAFFGIMFFMCGMGYYFNKMKKEEGGN